MRKITHKGIEVEKFLTSYFDNEKRVLFIGTVGFNDVSLYFPLALSKSPNIDYKFFIEERTIVPSLLMEAGINHRKILETKLSSHSLEFTSIQIIAEDTATVGGRNAVKQCSTWLKDTYTDIVLDVTSMSRGVCFSVAKQVVLFAHENGLNPHILVAERGWADIKVRAMASDVASFMHGFQKDMDTDSVSNALLMWVPQLSEDAGPSLERIFSSLKPDEVCPVLPFPSAIPRRADDLMVEFHEPLRGSWDVSFLDTIYANESDPLDVCETIGRLHKTRTDVFDNVNNVISASTNIPTRTILSPSGWRIGSLGMFLAAMEHDLPVMYTESIGYTLIGDKLPSINLDRPDCRWHLWLIPEQATIS